MTPRRSGLRGKTDRNFRTDSAGGLSASCDGHGLNFDLSEFNTGTSGQLPHFVRGRLACDLIKRMRTAPRKMAELTFADRGKVLELRDHCLAQCYSRRTKCATSIKGSSRVCSKENSGG